MLPIKTLRASLLGLAIATPGAAEEHVIILTGFSYFPAVTYAQPGDSVKFINESGGEETVVGRDTGWVIGPLADAEEGSLVVNEETELSFFSAYACGDGEEEQSCANSGNEGEKSPDYGRYEDADVKAEISFDEPVLEATQSDGG